MAERSQLGCQVVQEMANLFARSSVANSYTKNQTKRDDEHGIFRNLGLDKRRTWKGQRQRWVSKRQAQRISQIGTNRRGRQRKRFWDNTGYIYKVRVAQTEHSEKSGWEAPAKLQQKGQSSKFLSWDSTKIIYLFLCLSHRDAFSLTSGLRIHAQAFSKTRMCRLCKKNPKEFTASQSSRSQKFAIHF